MPSMRPPSTTHGWKPKTWLQNCRSKNKTDWLCPVWTCTSRAGTFFQKDTTVVHCSTRQEGLEIVPMRRALENYDWIGRYYWQPVPVDTDKYTATAELQLHDGYVIRALPGSRSIYPVQACLYMDKNKLQQNVHNIVIVEEGAELHIITGCVVSPHLETGLHVGISEFFVKRNAKLIFTMIHNWTDQVDVRPRSAAQVEAGGLFVSNFISLKPVGSLQMDPVAFLTGQGAVTRIYSIIAGSPGARYDVGGRVFLKQPNTRAEIIARTISNGGHITARGHMIGETPGIKAHLECHGLILNGGVIHAIPELEGQTDNIEMSHEAAVGKIAQEEILYLMARGQTEEQAVSTIIRGFLNVDIPELPPPLKKEIDRNIEALKQEMM
ncbi:MAG: SufD family Fe-S cluster assembly protein [Desulfobacteraceae bacterium]